jgi:glucose dehydrogenase
VIVREAGLLYDANRQCVSPPNVSGVTEIPTIAGVRGLMATFPALLLVASVAFATGCGGDDGAGAAGRPRGGEADDAAHAVAESDATMRAATADSGSWPSYGRDYTNRRYSPLRQITTANAGRLDLA